MNRFITLSVAVLLGLVSANQISQEPSFLVDLTDAEKVSCYIYKDLTYFDLTALYSETGYTSGSYTYNFCKSLSLNNTDGTVSQAYAYQTDSVTGAVTIFADGGDLTPDTVNVYDVDGVRNVRYSFNSNTTCPADSTRTLSTIYEVTCSEDATLTNNKVTAGDCYITISGSAKSACAKFQATAIVDFLTKYPWIVGVILIVFGTISLFFGGKWFPYILATIGGGITFIVIIVFASVLGLLNALDTKNKASTGQIALSIFVFIVAIAAAVFVGWFVKKARRVGGTIAAAAGGFFGGFILYNLVFAAWWNNIACLLILSIGLAVVAGFFAWKFDKLIIVYLTAAIGGYALVRGISTFTGNFPNEVTTYQQIISGTFVLSNYFYVYLASIVVAVLAGIIVQWKLGYSEHCHEDDYVKIN